MTISIYQVERSKYLVNTKTKVKFPLTSGHSNRIMRELVVTTRRVRPATIKKYRYVDTIKQVGSMRYKPTLKCSQAGKKLKRCSNK